MDLPQDVQQFLKQHAPHFTATPEGKVKCELNGHTFPPKADALQAFINGKKYGKLLQQADTAASLAKYEPFIVPSKNLPGALFCALTGELLNARLQEVKQHMKGKKFARARERFESDLQELLEEPGMEGSDMEEDGVEGSEGPGVWLPEEVLREYEMGEAADGDAEGEEGEEEEGEEEVQEGEGEEAGDDDEEAAAAAATAAGGKDEERAAAVAAAAASSGRGAKGKAAKGSKGAAPVAAAAAAAANGGGQPAAANGGKGKQRQQKAARGGKGKQQQQAEAPAAEVASGAGGNGKPPKAKRVRTK